MGPSRSIERGASLYDLPVWIRAAAIVGIPGLIAVYLVWTLTNNVATRIEAHTTESRDAGERQFQMLQQICTNTATTPEARASCWRVAP
jgi:hypothetical protein